jgi:acyl carrier protein
MAANTDKVKDIIEKELGVEREKLVDSASFIDDLGADSLDIVELVMEFEKEFNIDIPDEEAEKLRTGRRRDRVPEREGRRVSGRRVVVTGLGALTPVGNDVAATWRALLDGRSGGAPITRFDAERFAVRFACEVKDFDASLYMDRKEAKRATCTRSTRWPQRAGHAGRRLRRRRGPGRGTRPRSSGVVIGSGHRRAAHDGGAARDVHRAGAAPHLAVLRADVHQRHRRRRGVDAVRAEGAELRDGQRLLDERARAWAWRRGPSSTARPT